VTKKYFQTKSDKSQFAKESLGNRLRKINEVQRTVVASNFPTGISKDKRNKPNKKRLVACIGFASLLPAPQCTI